MKTQSFKQSDIEQSWILVDAKDKTLGRLASALASRLRGKHRPEYTPNADLGDYIVVINANKIKRYMNKKELLLEINLNTGKESATVYTCDLTQEYIKINLPLMLA